MKVFGWENYLNALAINNIKKTLEKESEIDDSLRVDNSWRWAERKIKELAPKQEIDHTTDGEKITSVEVTIKRNETGTGSDTDIR